MKREWNFKPGDVALVKRGPSWTGRAIMTFDGWIDQSGDHDDHPPLFDVTDARPLVLIDLSEEPVEGDIPGRNEAQLLVSMLRETADNFFTPKAATLARKVAEQIEAQTADPKPPRPEESTGLGAVVEDAGGARWVHVAGGQWSRGYGPSRRHGRWSDINAVRVLSEGVQP